VAEERRRGLTIDLGLRVDQAARRGAGGVHRRARSRALSCKHAGGLGPGARVLFVVAADGGWMPQVGRAPGRRRTPSASGTACSPSTRSDLADPGPAMREALEPHLPYQPGAVPGVAVRRSPRRAARPAGCAGRLVAALPVPDPPARSGSGSTGRSASGAAVPSSPARWPAGTVTTGRTAAHPVDAARQDPGPGIHERARSRPAVGVAPRGSQPARPSRRLRGARHGPWSSGPLDP